eukprot:7372930-Pyramimonas_sp.AAC.1
MQGEGRTACMPFCSEEEELFGREKEPILLLRRLEHRPFSIGKSLGDWTRALGVGGAGGRGGG